MPEMLNQLADWFCQLQLIWILLGVLKIALVATLLVLAWRYPKTVLATMMIGLGALFIMLGCL